jgi:hypothetical protein
MYLDPDPVRQSRVLDTVTIAERIAGRETQHKQSTDAEEKKHLFHTEIFFLVNLYLRLSQEIVLKRFI